MEDRTLLSFGAAINYPVGGSPQDMVAGDFTGTGIQDLAVANSNGLVSILLGNGDGTFQTPRTFPAGLHPADIVAADLTGNGIFDLVVSRDDETLATHTVSVLLGNGDGTFQTPVEYEAGNNPHGIAIGDLNGDGIPDIVVTNKGFFLGDSFQPGTTVSVLLGHGDGTFGAPRTFDTGVTPEGVALGDFAGDGRLSIVTADQGFAGVPGDAAFLRGNGDGTFQEPVSLGLGAPGAARSVAVADLNGDGHPDIFTAADGGNGGIVSVMLGRGDNTFQNAVAYPASNNPGFLPLRTVAGNFSGAGHLDLAVSGFLGTGSAGLSVLPGNGDGTFQAPIGFGAGQLPDALAVGDFTGAGLSDLAVANTSGSNVSIFLANPDGFFFAPSTIAVGVNGTDLHSVDLTGSGVPDLVTVNPQTNTVNVQLGNGGGTFQDPTAYAVGQKPRSVTVADLTGSGPLDLVVVNEGDRTLSVLLGNGDGTFQPAQTITPQLDDGFIPVRVAVGDFDGDGTPDLAVLQRVMNGQNDRSAVLVLHGNGDGTFSQNLPNRTVPFFVSDFLTNFILQAADLRHNGTLDLVIGGGFSGVVVLLGHGDGTFGAPQLLHTGRFNGNLATAAVVADVNGDGIPDLIVTNYEGASGTPDEVSVLLGNGDGTFQPQVLYPVDFAPISLAVGDFFGDGILGVATANLGSNSVSVLRGHGDGTFGSATSYVVGTGGAQIVAGDFNGDGAPDLAVLHISRGGGNLSVVLNRNDGTAPGQRAATKLSHHATGRARLARPDTTLAQAVAPTPVSLRLDKTASATRAPILGRQVSPTDAYFAVLAREARDPSQHHNQPAESIAAKTRLPVGIPDKVFTSLGAGLSAALLDE